MPRRAQFFGLFATAALLAMTLAYGAQRLIVEGWQRDYLGELAMQTVNRTDVAIDRAVIAIGAMIENGLTECSADAVAFSRRTVFDGGAIRDVQIRNGDRFCQAFEELSAPGRPAVEWHAARNGRIHLARVAQGNADQLAVRWSVGPDSDIVAVMNTELLVFDVLPAALRTGSSIELFVGADSRVVEQGHGAIDPSASRTFEASSGRYPTRVSITVSEPTLAAWGGGFDRITALGSALIALVFGYAVARAFVRGRTFCDDFRQALSRGEVGAHYQPIVALDDRRPVGFEMLARWQRPDGSFVPPSQFIPMVELNGCADALIVHLLRRADTEIGRHFAEDRSLFLSVNITPEQFERPGFCAWLRGVVGETEFTRSQIVVEVTERQQLASPDRAQAVSLELQEAGFGVALDDAGTGHNGLAVMKSLCAGRVKIDKMFIDEIDNDTRTRALVEMLVGAAAELGMDSVAEGIEREEQAAVLATMGVAFAQGYLFCRPLPAAALDAYLAGFAAPDSAARSPRARAA